MVSVEMCKMCLKDYKTSCFTLKAMTLLPYSEHIFRRVGTIFFSFENTVKSVIF